MYVISIIYSFLLLNILSQYGYPLILIHLLVALGFQCLIITSNAAKNVHVQVCLWMYAFISLR